MSWGSNICPANKKVFPWSPPRVPLLVSPLACDRSFALPPAPPRLAISLPSRTHLNAVLSARPPLPGLAVTPHPCVSVGAGEGAGADKWDSAVLEPIIMPRLSLNDAGDLNSVTQTYISLSGSVCVCVCIKDMHDILPYPLPRSRCLVCRHRRAISDRPNTHVPAAARRAQTHTIWFNPGWIFWAVFRCVGCSRSTRLQRDSGVQVYEYMLNVRILWGTDTLEPAFISVFSLSDRSWWNTLTTPPTRAIWGWHWTPWRYANRVNHAPFLACSASHLVAPAFGL